MEELLLQLQIRHFAEYSVLTWTPDTCWSPSEGAKPRTTGSGVEDAARRLAASPGRDNTVQKKWWGIAPLYNKDLYRLTSCVWSLPLFSRMWARRLSFFRFMKRMQLCIRFCSTSTHWEQMWILLINIFYLEHRHKFENKSAWFLSLNMYLTPSLAPFALRFWISLIRLARLSHDSLNCL